MIRNFTLPLFAALACLSIPATAQNDPIIAMGKPAIKEGTASVRVPYSDLNMRLDEHVTVLTTRVRTASKQVCRTLYKHNPPINYVEEAICSRNAFRDGRQQIAKVAARYRGSDMVGLSKAPAIVIAVR